MFLTTEDGQHLEQYVDTLVVNTFEANEIGFWHGGEYDRLHEISPVLTLVDYAVRFSSHGVWFEGMQPLLQDKYRYRRARLVVPGQHECPELTNVIRILPSPRSNYVP